MNTLAVKGDKKKKKKKAVEGKLSIGQSRRKVTTLEAGGP